MPGPFRGPSSIHHRSSHWTPSGRHPVANERQKECSSDDDPEAGKAEAPDVAAEEKAAEIGADHRTGDARKGRTAQPRMAGLLPLLPDEPHHQPGDDTKTIDGRRFIGAP
jgi:hypothetical protein